MSDNPVMLDIVKAASNPDRLRIIGALTRGPASAVQITEALGISFRTAVNHLAFLVHLGILQTHAAGRKQDDLYELDLSGMENLARLQFASPRAKYAPELDVKSRKVLATYLNADGTIQQIPFQATKLKVILQYLIAAFEPGMNYTEKEVNAILRRFHEDTAGLRRDLVDAGLMDRESDGSRYWRVS